MLHSPPRYRLIHNMAYNVSIRHARAIQMQGLKLRHPQVPVLFTIPKFLILELPVESVYPIRRHIGMVVFTSIISRQDENITRVYFSFNGSTGCNFIYLKYRKFHPELNFSIMVRKYTVKISVLYTKYLAFLLFGEAKPKNPING